MPTRPTTQQVSRERLERFFRTMPFGPTYFFRAPRGGGKLDLHVCRAATTVYYVTYATSTTVLLESRTAPDDENGSYDMVLVRNIKTDDCTAEPHIFKDASTLADHAFAMLTGKSCKTCHTYFAGSSPDESLTICATCYMECKDLPLSPPDAICVVCHDEGKEMEGRIAIKTPCCGKVLCMRCRYALKSTHRDGAYGEPCPNCRVIMRSINAISHEDVRAMIGVVSLTGADGRRP